MELEPPGDLVGGRGFEEIGAADLEATVSWRLGLPEENDRSWERAMAVGCRLSK
jgi:hypothetical protein